MSNITPLRAEYASATGLRERIAVRAYALLNLLGSDGRMMLTKSETDELIWRASSKREASANEFAGFQQLEARLREQYGTASKPSVFCHDGKVDPRRDPRARAPISYPMAPTAAAAAPAASDERLCPCCGHVGGKPHVASLPTVLPDNVARFPVKRHRKGRGPHRAA